MDEDRGRHVGLKTAFLGVPQISCLIIIYPIEFAFILGRPIPRRKTFFLFAFAKPKVIPACSLTLQWVVYMEKRVHTAPCAEFGSECVANVVWKITLSCDGLSRTDNRDCVYYYTSEILCMNIYIYMHIYIILCHISYHDRKHHFYIKYTLEF